MPFIHHFEALIQHLLSHREGGRKRLVVVNPCDEHTITALRRMYAEGLADLLLVGHVQPTDFDTCTAGDPTQHITYYHYEDSAEAAAFAVHLIATQQGDILMKGLINTDTLLRAVLHRQDGILDEDAVLSHVALLEMSVQRRLICFMDAAVIPSPTLPQLVAMTVYACRTMRALGVTTPRIALIHFTEKVSDKFVITQHYTQLIKMATRGTFGDIIMDGPMDVGCALSADFARAKGLSSPIKGKADILLFPSLEAANVFYKTTNILAHTPMAGMLVGAQCPIILPSRGDSAGTKYRSLALASLVYA